MGGAKDVTREPRFSQNLAWCPMRLYWFLLDIDFTLFQKHNLSFRVTQPSMSGSDPTFVCSEIEIYWCIFWVTISTVVANNCVKHFRFQLHFMITSWISLIACKQAGLVVLDVHRNQGLGIRVDWGFFYFFVLAVCSGMQAAVNIIVLFISLRN